MLPAAWTLGAISSLILNAILIAVVIILLNQLFTIRQILTRQLVGGLYYNFILMDQATIRADVAVNNQVPVQFDLRVQTNTNVTLTEATRINGAQVGILNAPTNIVLPAGTVLPVALDMVVPVNTTIPIEMNVPIDIPLNQTELHQPFVGLQDVVSPYFNVLAPTPDSWSEWFCRSWLGGLCP
jgi:hypothetical protein